MEKFFKFIFQNITYIKYSLLILVIFSMIFSVRTYLKHTYIEEEIKNVDQTTANRIEEMNYQKKFVFSYLSSEYSDFFWKHENNNLFPNEYIIEFEAMSSQIETPKEEIKPQSFNPLSSPKDARKHFLTEKFSRIK